MRGHNLLFYGQKMEIIPKLSLLPLLTWSSVVLSPRKAILYCFTTLNVIISNVKGVFI